MKKLGIKRAHLMEYMVYKAAYVSFECIMQLRILEDKNAYEKSTELVTYDY